MGMMRRSFFRSFLGLPFLPVAKSAAEQKMDNLMLLPDGEQFKAGKWIVFWTGWKEVMTSITLAGQWVAMSRERLWIKPDYLSQHQWDSLSPQTRDRLGVNDMWGLYASAPGGHGPFRRGDCFNIDAESEKQLRLQYGDVNAEAEKLKRDALERLMRLIDKYPDPSLPYPKFRR